MNPDLDPQSRLAQSPTPLAHRWDEAFTPIRFMLLLAVLISVSFSDVVFGGATFFVRDYARFGYPLALHHQNSFWAGEIPLWNPLNSCGIPFLAQWNTIVLYPGSLLYLLLPLSWALSMFNLLHLLLGGMGMYFLGRHVAGWKLAGAVAGVAYAFNGFTLNSLMWPNYMVSLGWLPWVLLVGDWALAHGGRRVFSAGVVATMQLLSGTPELTALTWLVFGVFAVARVIDRRNRVVVVSIRLFGIASVAFLLSAVQLLPFVELLQHSDRTGEYAGNVWPMLDLGWARLVLPSFYGVRTSMGIIMDPAQSFTNSYYQGIVLLVLASLAVVRARSSSVAGLIFLSLFALTMALGDAGHLYPFLCKVWPPVGLMRYPVKFVMILTIVAPLLAAWGMAAIASTDAEGRCARQFRNRCLISGGILLVVIVLLVWFESSYPVLVGGQFWSVSGPNAVVRSGFLIGGVGMLLLILRFPQHRVRFISGLLFLTLLWLDLLTHTPRQNPTVARSAFQSGFAPLQELNPRPVLGHSRAAITPASDLRFQLGWIPDPFQNVLLTRLGMTGNANILDDLPKAGGFYALSLHETSQIEEAMFLNPNRCRTNIADFLSISQLNQLSSELEQGEATNEPGPSKPFEWVARKNYLPIVTAGMRPHYLDQNKALGFLCSEEFDPRNVVVLGEDYRDRLPWTNSVNAEVFPSVFSAHQIAFMVRSPAPTMVVIGQSFHPSWKAYVDGRPIPLIRANYAFQALPIDAGAHEVLIRYVDRKFQLGLLISALTMAGGAFFCCRAESRRRRLYSDGLRTTSGTGTLD